MQDAKIVRGFFLIVLLGPALCLGSETSGCPAPEEVIGSLVAPVPAEYYDLKYAKLPDGFLATKVTVHLDPNERTLESFIVRVSGESDEELVALIPLRITEQSDTTVVGDFYLMHNAMPRFIVMIEIGYIDTADDAKCIKKKVTYGISLPAIKPID